MLNYICRKIRPKTRDLIEDELYQAEREVIGQAERCYRLTIAAEQADVIMEHATKRRDSLREQLADYDNKPKSSFL